MVKAELYLLGVGTPTPTETRFGTSQVLRLGDDYLMFDCGPATTHKLVKARLFPTQIDYLFITHHHFDHNVDLPCFLLTRWDQSVGKEGLLRIWGPSPTSLIIERLVGPEGVFALDWRARIKAPVSQRVYMNRGGASLPRPEPRFWVRDIRPGVVFQHHGWEVTAARAQHVEPWLDSLAYRVDVEGRSIVFLGDTAPCDSIRALAAGADVIVANCWDHQMTMEENGEVLGQTGTLSAAEMAREAGADLLILTHTGPALVAPGSKERAIGDIARIYPGRIIFGEELMSIALWRTVGQG